jgi:hypothetical protein
MPLRSPLRAVLLAMLLIAATAVAVGCGSSGDDTSPPAQPRPTARPEDFPDASGRSLADLVSSMPEGPVLAPSVQLLEKGTNRVGFALFDTARKQIAGAPVALYVSKPDGSDAAGPFVARSESLQVKPQFQSKQTATDPDAAKSVYVADAKFPRKGRYAVLAIVKLDGRTVATSPISMEVRKSGPKPPGPGEKAPRIHTLTPADVSGDLAKIDTRIPPAPELLKTDFADVLGKKPVVLTFATPQLCVSRVCGPVVDVVAQVQSQFGDKVAFVHQEIYNDNDTSKGLRPQLAPYKLETEPWTFVIDKTGKVSSRFEGAFSPGELSRAVAKVADPK